MKFSPKLIKQSLILAVIASAALNNQYALAATASSTQQYGIYVILGQSPAGDNIAIARTVIDPALSCPTISGGSTTLTMATRDNPNHFPVMVCEAIIKFDQQYQLKFSDKALNLPIAKSNSQHIQVFGDTGCKTSDCALGTAAQPFKSLADSGAASKPDLVLHMGDFNYRGTGGDVLFTTKDASGALVQQAQWAYDAGDDLTKSEHCGQQPGTPYYSQSALNSNHPDIWTYWHDDLFMSAQNLMSAAPWIATRGNHELCSRAGPGYFYFLDSNSNLVKGGQQLSCSALKVNGDAMANTLQIPNYTLSFDKLDIAVIDSANACDSYVDSPFEAVYKKVFTELSASVSKKDTWLMTHRPVWGVQAFDASTSTGCSSANQFACIDQMMQRAISAQPTGSLPESIKLILSGHMHKFESVSFDNGKQPPNLIVGSSGVQLWGDEPIGGVSLTINKLPAKALSTNMQVVKNKITYDAFGFFNITLDTNGGWEGELINPAKNLTLVNCSSKQNLAQGVCELATGVSVAGD